MLRYTTVVCREEGIDVEKAQSDIAAMDSGAHAMGNRIWELTAKTITINNICKVLERDFDITDKDCYDETTAFLGKLLELKIIKVTETSQTKKIPKLPRSTPKSD
ncbi:PqqD family protein [Candidatus Uabimicrobium amorphum]|uniref:PqqD family protein n=1 Tax=Uabimicrobium amorphum TaxID=2596890 RepID=A0A5S9IMY1_UABAM|nr:PqqD family protein [Candidatus Uabimicrobium amorphum]BBM84386.1 hypothetical protein UABAM_02745 [Candidatus Uabimicrobium amorphum]